MNKHIWMYLYICHYQKQGKGTVLPLMEVFHGTATECHLPCVITQCYLTDTSEHTPPWPQPYRPVLDLTTPEGWKA